MSKLALSRRGLLQGISAAAFVAATPAFARTRPARDPFVERLIAQMGIEEKAGQLSLFGDTVRWEGAAVNPEALQKNFDQTAADIAAGKVTGLFNGVGVAQGRALQRIAVEQSPSKIPLIFGGDVIHGMRTAFPIPLGEAASFDVDLAERTARAAAVEATARGMHWTFAPMVDIARDQRWGRVAEGSGEDTYLGSLLAAARVRGFQGEGLKRDDTMLACPKHFAAYGAVEGGMEYNTADIPETTLRQTHLPPFKASFDAGALSTMSSFNDIAGVPATGNRHLLTEILREEWGFAGFVVSDYTSEEELILHGFAEDGADAVAKALTAGCDMSMQSGLYLKHIPDLVRSGRLPEAVVDQAVRRVLTVKKALGLFDNPYRSLDERREQTDLRKPETVALAREAARKSIVLLKNEGGLLPLPKSGKKIALIGPLAADKANMPGPWSIWPQIDLCVTFEEGLRAALRNPADLRVVKGSDIEAPIDGGIAEAVAAARAADVVVLAIGESAGMSGEAQSRTDIVVPPPQQALAEAVAAVGKPMVVTLTHGRALALAGAVAKAPAILATWFLGSEAGNGLADILFGDFAPQGRLPISFPQASGQQPFYYNHRNTGRPQVSDDKNYKARYREVTFAPLYPFGHGLGYAAITYGPTETSARELGAGDTLVASAVIKNEGRREAHEVAQLYIQDLVASITQPVRSLRGFRHLDLAPGQSQRVTFELRRDDLSFIGADGRPRAEPGAFRVWIAPSATAGVPATFSLKA